MGAIKKKQIIFELREQANELKSQLRKSKEAIELYEKHSKEALNDI